MLRELIKPTSEFVMNRVSQLNVQTNQMSRCARISLQPGVTLNVTEGNKR